MKDQSINAIIAFIHFPLYSFFLFKCCISLHWIICDANFDLSDVALNVKFNMRLMVLMKNISHLTLLLYMFRYSTANEF